MRAQRRHKHTGPPLTTEFKDYYLLHTLRKNNNIPNIVKRVNRSKSSHGMLDAAVFCTWAVRFCSSFCLKKKTQQRNNFNFDLFVRLISIDFDFITMQPIFRFCRRRRCSCQHFKYLCVLVLFSFDGRKKISVSLWRLLMFIVCAFIRWCF